MKVNDNFTITKKGNDYFLVMTDSNGNSCKTYIPSGSNNELDDFYSRARCDMNIREDLYNNYKEIYGEDFWDKLLGIGTEQKKEVILSNEKRLERGLSALMNFFTEFEFEPNFRFVNTLTKKACDNPIKAKEYIANYFSLMDNSYTNEIKAKINSKEFANILTDISACGLPKKNVNTRFKIYYGSAGTGKTTLAQTETGNRCLVCNASMLPSDLMEDFVFVNGQPSFKPSKVWECMENGLPIVFDEINLLPFDSLRFLQGVLDGKKEFDYKGHKVHIADGFEIIGTMNLSIGGMIYGLPEPLVDRASDMRKFRLSANQLMKAVLE